jgi:hypothetical protein
LYLDGSIISRSNWKPSDNSTQTEQKSGTSWSRVKPRSFRRKSQHTLLWLSFYVFLQKEDILTFDCCSEFVPFSLQQITRQFQFQEGKVTSRSLDNTNLTNATHRSLTFRSRVQISPSLSIFSFPLVVHSIKNQQERRRKQTKHDSSPTFSRTRRTATACKYFIPLELASAVETWSNDIHFLLSTLFSTFSFDADIVCSQLFFKEKNTF